MQIEVRPEYLKEIKSCLLSLFLLIFQNNWLILEVSNRKVVLKLFDSLKFIDFPDEFLIFSVGTAVAFINFRRVCMDEFMGLASSVHEPVFDCEKNRIHTMQEDEMKQRRSRPGAEPREQIPFGFVVWNST